MAVPLPSQFPLSIAKDVLSTHNTNHTESILVNLDLVSPMVARFSPILLLFMFFTFPCSKSQDYVRTRDCGGRNFTQNSTYHSNVRTLLSSLSSNATRNFAGFFNTTVGRDPDKVYGLFQCRGDISEDDCANCVRQITGYALQDCPYTKDPCFWDVKCWLSYSDVNIFSLMRKDPFDFPKLTSNVTDQDRFVRELAASLKSAAAEAAETTAVKKYATRQMNFTDFLTVYTLAQCTADMSHVDCSACLQGAIADLGDYMAGRRGGAILYPSCILRYELYQFYDAPSPSDSPVAASPGKNQRPIWKVIAIVASISIPLVLLFNAYYVLCRREKSKDRPNKKPIKGWTQVTVMEPLQYDFCVIKTATGNFSSNNLLGQGGFGDVYKGILGDGQEIAVKRLSRSSVQGTDEFKNEVRLLAKLQHRNLVRLFGFCLESDEKILIYEFVPNQSLDIFLFDHEKRKQLNWEKRYGLIGGIARGLLYLHEDSRLRIIHRDLKASNILLDIDMNPRISDFGIAKIVDQTLANTCRVVGTFGYIPPEFIIRGQFSLKSDVYSFGVLMLEIISGKKNYSFSETDPVDNLVSHAWKTWRNGTALELVDESVKKASYSEEEVMRCINIALLCVQEVPTDRPTMAMVVYMLNSGFGASLPSPQPPAFLFGIGTDSSQATSTTTATGHLLSTRSTTITPPSSEEGSRVEV